MSTTTANRRKLNIVQNGSNAEKVDAQSRYELYHDEGATNAFALWWLRFFSFFGMYTPPTVSQVVFASFREVLGCTVISATVGLVAFFSVGLNVLLGGVLVGAAYYGAYSLATRLPMDETLRGHYNGAITMGYVVMSRIGFFGAIGYLAAQLVGSIFGGLLLAYALEMYVPAAAPIVQSTVPLPTTTITNFGTVFALEMVGAGIVTLFLLIGEFVGTDPAPEKVGKNYRRGVKYAAGALFALVVLGFPLQIFTYSNVAYFGGLFGNVRNLDAGREMADLAQLYDPVKHAGSVFADAAGKGGQAWAHYYFTPLLGGIVGALVALAAYLARYNGQTNGSVGDVSNDRRATQSGQPMERITASAATQTPVQQLKSSFHKTS